MYSLTMVAKADCVSVPRILVTSASSEVAANTGFRSCSNGRQCEYSPDSDACTALAAEPTTEVTESNFEATAEVASPNNDVTSSNTTKRSEWSTFGRQCFYKEHSQPGAGAALAAKTGIKARTANLAYILKSRRLSEERNKGQHQAV